MTMTDNIPLQPVRQKKRMDSKHRGGCCECLRCCGRRDPRPRTVWLGHPEKRDQRYPRNVINNQKYNFFTFLPGVLFNQFKYFFNLYFLLLACSQFVVEMRLGALYTYWVPLGFVLAVTVIREAAEEIRCYMRDKEVNSQIYSKLTARATSSSSEEFRVPRLQISCVCSLALAIVYNLVAPNKDI